MDMPETALDTRTQTQLRAIVCCNGRGFTARFNHQEHECCQLIHANESYACECQCTYVCKWENFGWSHSFASKKQCIKLGEIP